MNRKFNNSEELAHAHKDLLSTCEELVNIIQSLVPTCKRLISIYENINFMDDANYYVDAEVDYHGDEANCDNDELDYVEPEVDYDGDATDSSDNEADLMIVLNEILKSEYQKYINDKDLYLKYFFDLMDENTYQRLTAIAYSRQTTLLEMLNITFVLDENGDSLIDYFTSLKSDYDSDKVTYNNNEVSYDSNVTDCGDDEADFMMMLNQIPKSAYENYINDRKNYLEYILDIMDSDTLKKLKNIASSHEMDLYQFININSVLNKNVASLMDYFISSKSDYDNNKANCDSNEVDYDGNEANYDSCELDYDDDEANYDSCELDYDDDEANYDSCEFDYDDDEVNYDSCELDYDDDEANYDSCELDYDDDEANYDSCELDYDDDEANYDSCELDYDGGEQNIPDYINDRENYINYCLDQFCSPLKDYLWCSAIDCDMSLYDYVNKIIDEKGEAHKDYFDDLATQLLKEENSHRNRKSDIQSKAIFAQYENIAKKNTILDPKKGDKYLKDKKKRKRLEKLAEQYETRVRVMY